MDGKTIWQFSRLQKTGGDSFRSHLIETFQDELTIYDKHFEFEFIADPAKYDCEMFLGHISPRAVVEIFPSARVIHLIRRPEQRLISCYHYWHSLTHIHAPGSAFFARLVDMSLLEFVTSEDPLFANTVYNSHARMLAGGRFGPTNNTRTCILGPQLPDDVVLQKAKEALDGSYFFGITEHMDESVRRFFRKIGRPAPNAARHINVGKARKVAPAPTADELAAIQARTRIDRQLYDYAVSKFLGDGNTGA